jgi:hypothetical protein
MENVIPSYDDIQMCNESVKVNVSGYSAGTGPRYHQAHREGSNLALEI